MYLINVRILGSVLVKSPLHQGMPELPQALVNENILSSSVNFHFEINTPPSVLDDFLFRLSTSGGAYQSNIWGALHFFFRKFLVSHAAFLQFYSGLL